MRIIAGEFGGRTLRIPRDAAFRPTTDRVRESLFSILEAQVDWLGLRVCDLFAGSGSLGLEALSRGAASAVFVEANRSHADDLRANLALFKLENRSELIVGRAESYLARVKNRFGLILADPPYDFTEYTALLERIAGGIDQSIGLVVLEHRSVVKPSVPTSLSIRDVRTYGTTSLTFLRHPEGEER